MTFKADGDKYVALIRRGKPGKMFQSFLPAGKACVEMREAPGCFSYFAADFYG